MLSKSKHIAGEDVIKANIKRATRRKDPNQHAPAYGARFYTEPVPKYKLPKDSMPANVAYQLVHDEMQLDGNTSQNMASFVSTWMEPEAKALIDETIGKNFADCDEYPQVQQIHQRCVSMLADLFHADHVQEQAACGASTVGSSEAFMLAGLAMKFRWRNMRKEQGKPHDKPNIVFGSNAQVVLHKFAVYFDVEQRLVPISKDSHYTLSVQEALKLVDENTIGVVAILGSTFTGHFEPVKELNKALTALNKKNGWDVGIHVDGASGAFVAPFLYPDLEWDFKIPLVRSINVSGHKYGLVYPGSGWVIWRSKAYLPEELIFRINYLGGDFPTFTLNFSRASSHVVAQYYNFLRLGFAGYKGIMENCATNARFLARCINETGYFDILSNADIGLPLVAFSVKDKDADFNEYDMMHTLRQRGWIVPAYNLTANCTDINVLRIVIREGHSEDMLEHLLLDLVWAYETLRDKPRQGFLTNKEVEKEKEKEDEKEKVKGKGRHQTQEEASAKGKKRKENETLEDKKGKKVRVNGNKKRHVRHGVC